MSDGMAPFSKLLEISLKRKETGDEQQGRITINRFPNYNMLNTYRIFNSDN
jgi:hypothetical protein